jgi:hypothetical protein
MEYVTRNECGVRCWRSEVNLMCGSSWKLVLRPAVLKEFSGKVLRLACLFQQLATFC